MVMGSWAWTIHNACFNHYWEFYIHFQKPFLFKGSKKITDSIFYIFSLKKLCVAYRQVFQRSWKPRCRVLSQSQTGNHSEWRHSSWCNFPKYLCLLIELIRLSTEHFFNLFKTSIFLSIIQRRNVPKGSCRTPPPPIILDEE